MEEKMKEEFKKYLDRKFFFFFKSKQIEDYKDELLDGMLQRYREFTAAGAEKAEAYKKTIAHFGDITKGVGALTDIRLTAKENIRRALRFVVMSLLYFLAVTTVYLTVSVISWQAGGPELWGIAAKYSYALGSLLYAFIISIACAMMAGIINKPPIKRLGVYGAIASITVFLYLLVSFALSDAGATFNGRSVYSITWVIFAAGGVAIIALDLLWSLKTRSKYMMLKFAVLGFLTYAAIYIALSLGLSALGFKAWQLTWLMWLFAAVALLIYLFFKLGNKKNGPTTADDFDETIHKKTDGFTVAEKSEEKPEASGDAE